MTKDCFKTIAKTCIISLVFLMVVPTSLLSQQQEEQPIRITSDKLEADNKAKKVIFIGAVRAVQGDIVITCRRMTVFYEGGESSSSGNAQDIKRIVAEGDVLLTQKNREVGGEKAEYFNKERKIEITGNAVAKEGLQIIRGHRIIYYLDEDRSVIEGAGVKQVEATIYPKEAKKP